MSKMNPGDGQLTIIDQEGNEKLCQILFTIDSEEFSKKYVVFFPIEEMNDDEDGQISLMAARYIEGEDGTGDLEEVDTDAEWAMLEAAVADFEEQMENEECDCDDCEHDCNEDDCDCHNHE